MFKTHKLIFKILL